MDHSLSNPVTRVPSQQDGTVNSQHNVKYASNRYLPDVEINPRSCPTREISTTADCSPQSRMRAQRGGESASQHSSIPRTTLQISGTFIETGPIRNSQLISADSTSNIRKPLNSYSGLSQHGIAHHLRSNASGTRPSTLEHDHTAKPTSSSSINSHSIDDMSLIPPTTTLQDNSSQGKLTRKRKATPGEANLAKKHGPEYPRQIEDTLSVPKSLLDKKKALLARQTTRCEDRSPVNNSQVPSTGGSTTNSPQPQKKANGRTLLPDGLPMDQLLERIKIQPLLMELLNDPAAGSLEHFISSGSNSPDREVVGQTPDNTPAKTHTSKPHRTEFRTLSLALRATPVPPLPRVAEARWRAARVAQVNASVPIIIYPVSKDTGTAESNSAQLPERVDSQSFNLQPTMFPTLPPGNSLPELMYRRAKE